MLDVPDAGKASTAERLSRDRSNSDFTGAVTADDTDKPSVERTTSGSTTMSAGAVPGETREERIARWVLRDEEGFLNPFSQVLVARAMPLVGNIYEIMMGFVVT